MALKHVEDNLTNPKLIEQLIARRLDMRLLTAGKGNDGIDLACVYLPDGSLMDINLPGISGIEAKKIPHQAHENESAHGNAGRGAGVCQEGYW